MSNCIFNPTNLNRFGRKIIICVFEFFQVVSLLKKSLSTSKVDGHTDRVFAIANHPTNAHEFVSSGWDNTLQVSNICLRIQSKVVILSIVYSFQPREIIFLLRL